jgi:integrase/recombinase XerD
MVETTDSKRKLLEELKLRGYSPRTVKSYTSIIVKFLQRTNKPVDNLCEEDVRKYLLILIDKKYARETIRLTRAAIKFFFVTILDKQISTSIVPLPKRAKKLPKVLELDEIKLLIDVTSNIKHKILIMIAFSSGVRVSELVALKVDDINVKSLTLRINQGKGNKDRLSIFSKSVRDLLLQYICQRKKQIEYLFPGRKGHISVRTFQEILKTAANKAKICKRVTPHMLRHSFATQLLEQGTDIRYIQSLLGHRRLETTQIYTRVSKTKLEHIQNPADRL